MLEMRAIVLNVQGSHAEISPLGGGCGMCLSAGGCGSGKLSQMFCSSQPRRFLARNEARARVGDEVRVCLPDGVLLRSSWRMYLLPLILALAGALLGSALASVPAYRDGWASLGALLGLAIGFFWSRRPSSISGTQAVVQSIVTSNHKT